MIELKRLQRTDKCTIGALAIDGNFICWTLEEPWLNNMKDVSCIPLGHYRAHEYQSAKFGKCYSITDLQNRQPANRSGILIHSGNTTNDTSGCILLGLEIGYLKGEKAVLKSKDAYTLFLNLMSGVASCDFIIT